MSTLSFEEIISRSERNAAELQPWTKYYRRRGLEVKLALALADIAPIGRALDLGCSSGFTTACLRAVAREVIGVDLPRRSMDTHSVGMTDAKEYLKRVDVSGCHLVGGSGEALPLDDRSVDLVYAMYVLEHVPDRVRMLAEIARVLKPGGRALVLVPALWERAQAPFVHARYLVTRLWERTAGAPSPDSTPADGAGENLSNGVWSLLRRKNPSFPLPEPHGAYPSWWQELWESRPSAWLRLFEGSPLTVERWFSTFLIPYGLLGIVSGNLPLWLYERTQGFHRDWAGREPLRRLGASFAVVARALEKA